MKILVKGLEHHLYVEPKKLIMYLGGGTQLKNWIEGKNKFGPKKTCPKDIQDGDYWTVEFDTSQVKDKRQAD